MRTEKAVRELLSKVEKCSKNCPAWFLNTETGRVEKCDDCWDSIAAAMTDEDMLALPEARTAVGTIDMFVHAYILAALWLTTDDDRVPLDEHHTYRDLDDAAETRMRADCAKFIEQNPEVTLDNAKQAGHDFWLTRNRHGSGFLDGDWAEPLANKFTKSAHAFGPARLEAYDGKVYHA